MIGRRVFLKDGALSVVGLSMVPGFLRRAVAALSPQAGKKTLVCIFQRGGADGLNIVVPFGEESYYRYRPSIGIKPPGSGEGAALDLDGFFGLHPGLEPLLPIYEQGDLGIIHAVGSPDTGNRSHFRAQDFMESAAPGDKTVGTGWLNRHLHYSPDDDATAFRGTAMGPALPKALRGPHPAVALGSINQFRMSGAGSILKTLYSEDSNSLLTGASRDMFDAIELLKQANPEQYSPAEGIQYAQNPNNPGPFARALMQVAQLIKADVGIEVAFVDIGNWDHHTDEGSIDGLMMQSLVPFGLALAAFYQDLGDRMEDVVVLTMSEFGRTARENGNRGTDHGHANIMFVMGGAVNGGKVYGEWPGLEREQLNEDRDLVLTTDFRDVFAEVLSGHLGATNLDPVFPDFSTDPKRFKGIVG